MSTHQLTSGDRKCDTSQTIGSKISVCTTVLSYAYINCHFLQGDERVKPGQSSSTKGSTAEPTGIAGIALLAPLPGH